MITEQQIQQVGGNHWTGRDGTYNRYYLNAAELMTFIGLETNHYNTGRISSATLDGELISNNKAGKIMDAINYSKTYWENGRIHTTMAEPYRDWMIEGLEAAIAALPTDDEQDNDDDQCDADTAAPTQADTEQPTINPTDIITTLRVAGRTIRQIAATIGVAASTIYRWLRGTYKPNARNAARLATLTI